MKPNSKHSKTQLNKFELLFFQILIDVVKKKPVMLTIPETFISGFCNEGVLMLSTNYETGEIHMRQNVPQPALVDSFAFFEDLIKIKAKFPIAISKTLGAGCKDICKVLLSSQECIETWNRLEAVGKGHVVQRFIPSSWNVTIYRCFYDYGKNYCKILLLRKNNKNVYEHPALKKNIFRNVGITKIESDIDRASYCIKRLDQVSCNMNMLHSSLLTSKMEYISQMLETEYFKDRKIKLLTLNADWIQDPKGNFFLISVKSYQLRCEHGSLVIDRPGQELKKPRNEYSSTGIILKRSLSPPFSYPTRSLSNFRITNAESKLENSVKSNAKSFL